MQVPLKTTERHRLDADNLLRGCMQECFITKSGVKECIDGEMIWELADPDMKDIPDNFLKGNTDLAGTLKVAGRGRRDDRDQRLLQDKPRGRPVAGEIARVDR